MAHAINRVGTNALLDSDAGADVCADSFADASGDAFAFVFAISEFRLSWDEARLNDLATRGLATPP